MSSKEKRPGRTHYTLLQRAQTAQRPSRKKKCQLSLMVMLKSHLEMNSGELCCLPEQAKINVLRPASFLFPVPSQHKGNLYVFRLPLRLHVIISSPNLPGRHRYVPTGFTCTCVCSENLRRGFCHRAWFTVKFMPLL